MNAKFNRFLEVVKQQNVVDALITAAMVGCAVFVANNASTKTSLTLIETESVTVK